MKNNWKTGESYAIITGLILLLILFMNNNFATSDHAPMVLHFIATTDSGSKLFRYFNFWAQCDGYKEVINKAWSTGFNGSPQFQVAHELKEVKINLKEWRKTNSISTKTGINSNRQKLNLCMTH